MLLVQEVQFQCSSEFSILVLQSGACLYVALHLVKQASGVLFNARSSFAPKCCRCMDRLWHITLAIFFVESMYLIASS